MIEVSDVVRRKAEAAGAIDWLAGIDDLVGDATAQWGLTVEHMLEAATEALVLAVRRSDGTPAVLKLCITRGDTEHAANEAAVLRTAGGVGCAELFDADLTIGALLLERLGPPLSELDVPVDQRRDILCDVASTMWRPPPTDHSFMSGADKGRWLIDAIVSAWERLDHPCAEAVIEHAVRSAERRVAAHDPDRAVLVHGDVHQWNTLSASSTGLGSADGEFKLIDPDGIIAEPEYDLGVIIREDPVELRSEDPRAVAHRLARRVGCDATAVWEWGVVERVSTGLLCVEIGLQPVGDDMLETATQIVERS